MLGLNVKNEVLYRLYFVAGLVFICAVFIFGKMWQLSVTERPKWVKKAQQHYLKFVDVEAERGNIMAEDGALLATSLPFFDLRIDFASKGIKETTWNENVDSLALCLADHFPEKGWTAGNWRFVLDSLRTHGDDNQYWLLKKDAPFRETEKIKQFPLFRLGKFKGGLIAEQHFKRFYPYKINAHRTLGYVREGSLPVGIEGTFDKVLGGSRGQRLMMRVPGDVYIPVNDLTEIEPKGGDDLVTTLDVNIQDAAQNALLRACERHKADHGCAVVMEVKTGKIRAIANLGQTPAEGEEAKPGWWETFNYAIGQRVEPGSMFKAASFLAMLEDGFLDDLDEKVPVYRGKRKFYEDELVDAHAHGQDSMTVRECFFESSNVGTASLVQKFYGDSKKADRFVSRLKSFGLDLPTGIEVGGEEKPFLKEAGSSKDDWSGTTLPWMSIGYEMQITPLQMLNFFNATVNDGRLMQPYLIQSIESFGDKKQTFVPKVMRKSIASKSSLRQLRELMVSVVDSGTAKNIRTDLYKIGGKTGTAQLNYSKMKGTKNSGMRHQAGFCGFFPAENPEYSCIVVIWEPKVGGYHGSEVAAPVFREIADRCFAMKAQTHVAMNQRDLEKPTTARMPHADAGFQKDLKKAMRWLEMDYFLQKPKNVEAGFWSWGDAENDRSLGVLVAKNDTLTLAPRLVSEKTVPSVVGMGLKDAVYILENKGLKVRYSGVGKVRRQSVAPGTRANGQSVVIFLE